MRILASVSAAVVITLNVIPAQAQLRPDTVVGQMYGRPLVIERLDGSSVATLALAAGVPMGFEGAPPARSRPFRLAATGKPVHEVLDALTAADPRYAWRNDDGVLVVYPAAGGTAQPLLDSRIGSVALRDVDAAGAYNTLRRLFTGPGPSFGGPGDTKRFSLELPAGSTFQELLNAIVRAHGSLAWVLEETVSREGEASLTLSLFIGGSGIGVPVPARAFLFPAHTANLKAPGANAPADGGVPLLDRVVGTDHFGRPLVLHGGDFGADVTRLAAAAGVPMGVQTLPRVEEATVRTYGRGFTATGEPLRTALAALNSMDTRYAWRELDGTIVFRPVSAWSDPDDPLFRLVSNVLLTDAPAEKIIGALLAQIGAPERGATNQFSDTRRFSVDFPHGSVLDLLNLIVKSHGEMSWHWEELSQEEQKLWYRTGSRRILTFSVFRGHGQGYPLP